MLPTQQEHNSNKSHGKGLNYENFPFLLWQNITEHIHADINSSEVDVATPQPAEEHWSLK